MFDATRLIRYGYFPKELPPCFSTDDLADHTVEIIKALACCNPKYSIPLLYSGFKSEMARRTFAIPNPYHFCKTTDVIVRRENEIKPVLEKSRYSLRAPIEKMPKEGEAYAVKSSFPADTRDTVEKLYQDNSVEIRLDINACFDSIYTHSIPWAIHGIPTSKKNKSNSLVGNELDQCMQAMNYRQTNGILIGNDLSRIISEIILCTIDDQIRKKFPQIACCRFVDDYYIYTKDSSEIPQIIAFIRNALAVYHLSINETKVQVNESPFQYGKAWYVGMQQAIRLRSNDFLSWLINEYNMSKDPALLKYGLKVIDARKFSQQKRWQTMQSRILNVWVRYPFLADRILPMLWNNKQQLKKTNIKTAIVTVIDQSVLLRQDLELVWAVWFVKVFEIRISQETAVKILRSGNDLAIIILLDILDKTGLSGKPNIQKELRGLYDELKEANSDDNGNPGNLPWSSRWMLAYEAERSRRFDSIGETFDIVGKDPFFMKLLRLNIKFYNADFEYAENQFVKKKKKNYRKKLDSERIMDFITSPEFQAEIERGNQELTEQFMKMIEQAVEY